jgi:hypothetical protein
LRTKGQKFFYVPNIRQGELQNAKPISIRSHPRLEKMVGDKIEFVFSVVEKPKLQVNILATDPQEGIYRLTEEDAEYMTSLPGAAPLEKVSFIAFSGNKQMLALYADGDTSGNTIVCPADLSREINRQSTYKLGASQIYWCGNQCIVLTLKDKLAIVGPNDTEEIDVKTRQDGIICNTEDDGLRVTTAEHTHFFEIV